MPDPRPFAIGSIRATYEKYPHMTQLLPAMGYSEKQRHELEETIGRDPRLLRQPLAVDLERRAMEELVGVIDPDRPQASHISVGDAAQILESAIHRLQLSDHV